MMRKLWGKIPLALKVFPFYGLVIGLVFAASYQSIVKANEARSASRVMLKEIEAKHDDEKREIKAGAPVEVVIPSIGIAVNVVKGAIADATKQWTVGDGVANYAVTSPAPNTVEGRTFIYGHWTLDVFGRLHQVKPGEQVIVKTEDGHIFNYRLVSDKRVDPNDRSVLEDTQTGRGLILMTCAGIWAQYRYVQYYELESAV